MAICGECNGRMSSAKKTKPGGKTYNYYTCNSVQTGACRNPARMRKSDPDRMVNDFIESAIGDLPVIEKVTKSISESKVELQLARQRLERLETDFLMGRYDEEGQEESYWRMHKPLTGKVAKLRTEIAQAEHAPEFIDTGHIYRDEWMAKDDEQKRIFLQRHGVEIKVSGTASSGEPRSVNVKIPDLRKIAAVTGLRARDGKDWAEIATMDYKIPARRRRNSGPDEQAGSAERVTSQNI
ncbi:recombinase zinc beta ribbon domain-containing protein [Streptomyces sp. H39-S7]|nr:recombinase zinc beta ribbon domain-containing protein [Streptomyces sp. H39-S7]